MKCPFELPVEKTIKRPYANPYIENNEGKELCMCHDEAQADYIVQAINSHEKLKTALEEIEAVSCGEKQVAEDDSEGMGWIYKKIQGLRETEKL